VRSRRTAAIVIRIAPGTKNRPIEAAPITQHAHRSTAETIRAPRARTMIGRSERRTGTETTTTILEPLTEYPVALPHRVTPPATAEHVAYVGPNAATSAAASMARNATSTKPLLFTMAA